MDIRPIALTTGLISGAVKVWVVFAAFLILWDLYQINKEVKDVGRDNSK